MTKLAGRLSQLFVYASRGSMDRLFSILNSSFCFPFRFRQFPFRKTAFYTPNYQHE
jgi:hypothetical protein